jgi:predicted ATPase/DNA-binding winged helix-turn-helix (wHTH) protein
LSDTSAPASDDGVSFGPFCLYPARKLLVEGDGRVRLGSRALDLLIALVEAQGELVGKDDLIRKVWPGTFVEESNLRVHLAVLRKALGDGRDGARYIVNVPGRGYQFVAPVRPVAAAPPPSTLAGATIHHLPASLVHIIGRDETVASVTTQLRERRFVTIVGPGGIGKTTVALAVAETAGGGYRDGARFVDLSLVTDLRLVPGAFASALGLAVTSQNPIAGLAAALATRDMLVVLDNCEHVIEAAAALAEAIVRGAGGVHVLATSREPLRAAGERVYRLGPLDLPSTSTGHTAEEAMRFPAVQLFVERASASDSGFEMDDADTALVVDVCRRLDGIALAIELAAGRVDFFGLRGLAEHLDDRFRLLTQGRRTALPRHKTLGATVDWSYELLSAAEQRVFARLGTMAGSFSLDSAAAVAAGEGIDEADAIEAVASLVGKSMVAAEANRTAMSYRLLESMRVYALRRLADGGDLDRAARRHAEHFRALFAGAAADWETEPTGQWLDAWQGQIGNLRAALDWAFGPAGDTSIGIDLTVAAVPLWFQLSLIEECRERVETALGAVPGQLDPRRLMQLRAALGWSLMYTLGHVEETAAAWESALGVAETLGDADYRLRALWGLWAGHMNNARYDDAVRLGRRFLAIAEGLPGQPERYIGDRLVGAALHFVGDQAGARHHIERVLANYTRPVRRSDAVRFQFDQVITARITLTRVLWLQGHVDRALRLVEENIDDAIAVNHTLSISNALAQSACPVSLFAGRLDKAEQYMRQLAGLTAGEGVVIWHTYSLCFEGELLFRSGQSERGLDLLRSGVGQLRAAGFVQHRTTFLRALAIGLIESGQYEEAAAVIEEALAEAIASNQQWCRSELLRTKGDVVLGLGAAGARDDAEALYGQALAIAREQGVLSLELRTAISLARLRDLQGRGGEGRVILRSVYDRFSEGFDTADLITARAMIDAAA